MAAPTTSKVLLIIFPGFNTLDMNGPYEVLRRSGQSNIFGITVASETEITTSVEGVQVKVCQVNIADLLPLGLYHANFDPPTNKQIA
jgi:putative intracellular protease/amidase